jgi:hypothetical protein
VCFKIRTLEVQTAPSVTRFKSHVNTCWLNNRGRMCDLHHDASCASKDTNIDVCCKSIGKNLPNINTMVGALYLTCIMVQVVNNDCSCNTCLNCVYASAGTKHSHLSPRILLTKKSLVHCNCMYPAWFLTRHLHHDASEMCNLMNIRWSTATLTVPVLYMFSATRLGYCTKEYWMYGWMMYETFVMWRFKLQRTNVCTLDCHWCLGLSLNYACRAILLTSFCDDPTTASWTWLIHGLDRSSKVEVNPKYALSACWLCINFSHGDTC